jgi:hypothetical protein
MTIRVYIYNIFVDEYRCNKNMANFLKTKKLIRLYDKNIFPSLEISFIIYLYEYGIFLPVLVDLSTIPLNK